MFDELFLLRNPHANLGGCLNAVTNRMDTSSLVLAVLGLAIHVAHASNPSLRFKSDGTFKIALFTDLHYGESRTLDMKTDQVYYRVQGKETR